MSFLFSFSLIGKFGSEGFLFLGVDWEGEEEVNGVREGGLESMCEMVVEPNWVWRLELVQVFCGSRKLMITNIGCKRFLPSILSRTYTACTRKRLYHEPG